MAKNDGIDAGTMLVSFFAGAAVGIGAALLLTPKSGPELRGKVKEMVDDAVDKIKECASDAQEKIVSGFEEGKEAVLEKKSMFEAAIQAGKEAIEREKAKEK